MNQQEISAVKDPRIGSEFRPQFLPLSDLGDPPPVGTPQRNDCIRLEFLCAYYELNVAYARLLAAREDQFSEERSGIRREIERLQMIRDQLEDRYAPYGVIAEPAFARGFAVNVAFTFPNESRWFRQQRATKAWEAELRFSPPDPPGRSQ
jgi:hypothetical protein